MKVRRMLLVFSFLFACHLSYGQESISDPSDEVVQHKDKKINYGVKAGFNSTMYLVSKLKINDVTINEVQNNYRIGYFGTLFMRINMKKHYIQPEISYNVGKCEIEFDKLGADHPDVKPEYATVESVLHSIDLPILYGYNIVKKGPYAMSLFGGAKFRYLWAKQNKITYNNFDQENITEKLHPFNVSAVIGVSVNISRIFFDFRYEQEIGNISKSITYDVAESAATADANSITFHRRESALSFSLGFFF